jgi:hypothetical protein
VTGEAPSPSPLRPGCNGDQPCTVTHLIGRKYGMPSLLTPGVWLWGGILTLIFAAILISFYVASRHADGEGSGADGRWISGPYTVIRANGTVVAAFLQPSELRNLDFSRSPTDHRRPSKRRHLSHALASVWVLVPSTIRGQRPRPASAPNATTGAR